MDPEDLEHFLGLMNVACVIAIVGVLAVWGLVELLA